VEMAVFDIYAVNIMKKYSYPLIHSFIHSRVIGAPSPCTY
jgi:hypothetical protein